MNTKTKSLTSIVAVLILAITTFMLVGCNQTLPMSFAEFQDFQLSAAKTFKAQHTTVANFNDITYHWTESNVVKENVTLNYNLVATGDNYTTGTFEDKITTTSEKWLAIKKEVNKLVAKLTVNTTTVSTTNVVDNTQNNQLKTTTDTTVTQDIFYVETATKNSDNLNVVAHYNSTKENNENAVITTKYETVTNSDALTELVQGYALQYANKSVVRNFFGANELLFYPGYGASVVKTGNQVKFSFDYTFAEINANFVWAKMTASGSVIFENGKVLKTETTSSTVSENGSESMSIAFDYTNSATVETLDLDGYEQEEGIVEDYRNFCQSEIN